MPVALSRVTAPERMSSIETEVREAGTPGASARFASPASRPSRAGAPSRRRAPRSEERAGGSAAPRPCGEESLQELVAAYDGLASSCVRYFLRRYRIPPSLGLEPDDLLSEARLALCHAARAWDPARSSFATYASAAIHNWLLKACRLTRSASANRLEFVSLCTPVGDTGEDCLLDLLPDPDPLLDEKVCESQFTTDLRDAIAELPPRDRKVVESLLRGKTVAHIARDHGCSRQRIAHIQNRAIRRLQQRLRAWLDAPRPSGR